MRNYSRFMAVTAVAIAALLVAPVGTAQAHDIGNGEIIAEVPLATPVIPFNPLSSDLTAGSAAPWGGWAGDISVVDPRELPRDSVVFYSSHGPYGDTWVLNLDAGHPTGVWYPADGAFGDVACVESCDGDGLPAAAAPDPNGTSLLANQQRHLCNASGICAAEVLDVAGPVTPYGLAPALTAGVGTPWLLTP